MLGITICSRTNFIFAIVNIDCMWGKFTVSYDQYQLNNAWNLVLTRIYDINFLFFLLAAYCSIHCDQNKRSSQSEIAKQHERSESASANNHTQTHTQVGQWNEIAFCWQANKHTKLLLLLKMFLTLCYDLFVFIKIEIQRQNHAHKPKTWSHKASEMQACTHTQKHNVCCGFHFSELSH